jgi:glycyl-tRNA synthetase beta chain
VTALGLTAGRQTRGHRFQGAASVVIARADDYERALAKKAAVIASFGPSPRRCRRPARSARAGARPVAGSRAGCEALLDEVTALVEMPTVYAGAFEPEFLAVPSECLTLTMRLTRSTSRCSTTRASSPSRFSS